MVQQSEDSVLIEYPSGDGSQGGEALTIAKPGRDMRQRRKEKWYRRVKMMCSFNTQGGAGEDFLIGLY